MLLAPHRNQGRYTYMNGVKDKITRVKDAILNADENSSLKEIIDSDKAAFKGIRMLYSTNASGAQIQVDESLEHVFSGIFSKDRLLAYSDSIRSEMDIGTSIICFKQRAFLDTNLLSDLPKYFKDLEITTKQKVEDILAVIEKEYGRGFDYCFPMLENLRQFRAIVVKSHAIPHQKKYELSIATLC